MEFLAIARWVPTTREPKGDDGVDRLHYLYTPVILSVFTVLIGMQHYVGTPISCQTPDHLSGSQKKYATTWCWVQNTYYLPFHEEIPKDHAARDDAEIVYYQWLPLLLVAQAVLFYIPHTIWCTLNSKSGVDADDILQASESLEVTLKLETRESRLKLITNQIERFCASPRNRTRAFTFNLQSALSAFCCCCGKRFGNYLTLLYILIKCLYIGNVLLQFQLLGPVFKTGFYELGWTALKNAIAEEEIVHPSIFPKVTLCDFEVRRLGNNHRYTMQCVLPVNHFAEKMYIFIWFWFALLLLASALNLIMWVLRTVVATNRYQYIQDHLDTTNRLDTKRKKALVSKFVSDHLKQDGVFLLRLIAHNTSQLTAADVTASLWDAWLTRKGLGDAPPPVDEEEKAIADGNSRPESRRNSTYKPPLPTVAGSMPMHIPLMPMSGAMAAPAYEEEPSSPPYHAVFSELQPPLPQAGTPYSPHIYPWPQDGKI